MKKIMKMAAVAALMMLSATSAMAQYAPEKGDLSTELQFNPFGNNYNTFRLDGLKARFFVADKHAIRAMLNLGIDGNTTRATLNKNVVNYDKLKDDYTTTGNVNFGLGVGYEYHFMNSNRIDLYLGGQFGFDINAYSGEQETYLPAPVDGVQKTTFKGHDGAGNVSSANIYGQVFTGIDFYLYKGLYLGTEIALRLGVNGDTNYETEVSTPGAPTVTNEFDVKNGNVSLGFVRPALRIGWKF